jgi:hypothetical protein
MVGKFIAHDSKLPVWELESRAYGRSQHAAMPLVASPSKVCFRGEAEVGREAKPTYSVENDPTPDIQSDALIP